MSRKRKNYARHLASLELMLFRFSKEKRTRSNFSNAVIPENKNVSGIGVELAGGETDSHMPSVMSYVPEYTTTRPGGSLARPIVPEKHKPWFSEQDNSEQNFSVQLVADYNDEEYIHTRTRRKRELIDAVRISEQTDAVREFFSNHTMVVSADLQQRTLPKPILRLHL